MRKMKIRLDLCHGDWSEIFVEGEEEVAVLKELIEKINGKEWVNFGDTAIQTSYIKRISFPG